MDMSFDYAVSKLPGSPYKEEVMLMMLKSTSPFWDRLQHMMRYPGHLNIDKTSAPFRALINKYLPDISLDDSMIETREARTKLADKIEALKNPKSQAKVKGVELADASQPQAPAPAATPVPKSAPSPPASMVAEVLRRLSAARQCGLGLLESPPLQ
jgi:hypothetical protein